MLNKLIFSSLAAVISVSVVGASGLSSSPIHSTLPADPCPPFLTSPPPAPSDPAPAAPKNLRIVGGGLEDADYESEADETFGPYVEENEEPETAEAEAPFAAHAYFDMLTARADCMTSFHFRSQANIDLLKSHAEGDTKIPVAYNATHDGAKYEIDPSGSLPHSGATGTPQKRVPLGIQGVTSMLLTWDLKIAESMRWKPLTEQRMLPDRDGVLQLETVRYLDQHKSHRLDDRGASPWIGLKQNYVGAAKRGQGVAEFFFSAQTQYMGPGTTRGSSEKITPVLGEFYVNPDKWTRVWVFVEGNIGTADNAVKLSVWIADENREPMQLYNRVNMITPPEGIGLFRYEFDSSLKDALNGPGQQYQRNFVVLKGLSQAEVVSLLQKPVN